MNKLFIYTLFLALFAACTGSVDSVDEKHSFTLGDSVFLLDGKPIQIIAGELHYCRIPRPYWKDRLFKAKAMGLNAVGIYCMWNVHEPRDNQWDFTGRQDVRHFVELADSLGLYVILRPGPYVCAEWDYGGLPWWLLKNDTIKVRSDDPAFMKASKDYILRMGEALADLQVTNGGPIILVQVENEYGSFGSDVEYEKELAQYYKEAGFTVPFFTADGAAESYYKDGAVPGILPGGNGSPDPVEFKQLVNKYHGGKGPYFIPEFYPGWLDHWGEEFQIVKTDEIIDDIKEILDAGISMNIYMWHGGTNFAFMSGANYTQAHPIQPDLTSYDYDAPLSEAGVPTDKYMALRKLILDYLPEGKEIPEVPAPPEFISIDEIQLNQAAALLENLPEPVKNEELMTMEELDQGYGYVLYRTTLQQGGKGTLHIDGLRDYAQVFIEGKRVGTINRRLAEKELEINAQAGAQMGILVENMGRINYGSGMNYNRKGIIGSVRFMGDTLRGWAMFRLPFNDTEWIQFSKNKGEIAGPVMYKGTFDLEKVGDTFLDMRDWGKGIVFVNGHNLGRYWEIGPQQTLYLPGCWLKEKGNTIVVYEQLENGKKTISSLDHPILQQLSL